MLLSAMLQDIERFKEKEEKLREQLGAINETWQARFGEPSASFAFVPCKHTHSHKTHILTHTRTHAHIGHTRRTMHTCTHAHKDK